MLTDDFDPMRGQMLSILDQDGNIVDESLVPSLDDDMLERAFRNMVLSRVADEKAVTLQRQGRLGAYPPNRGQEAASLGPAMAMERSDWLVRAFRELAGLLWKGLPLDRYFLGWMGNEEGNRFGAENRITPSSIPVASQYAYAVGLSYASRYRREDAVTFAFTGDGGTSEGDFHESLNAAGVFSLPMVFIVQNNQWAISVPRSRQTASATIAQKAVAYGIKGLQVDGNDLLAMYAAAKDAADRARSGGGPTLIEAYTYRLGNHTTSDDARRYRLASESKEWEARDPLARLMKHLYAKGVLDDRKTEAIWKEARQTTEDAVSKAESFPPPSVEEVFRHTYEEMPPLLEEQMQHIRRDVGGGT
jgi:pyruvate dehydrogenase E1 component alpha subunit